MAARTDVKNLMGESGGIYIDDTATYTGDWAAMVVIEDTILTAITQPKFGGVDPSQIISPTIFSEGSVLVGNITSIKLASGLVQMINTPLAAHRNN